MKQRIITLIALLCAFAGMAWAETKTYIFSGSVVGQGQYAGYFYAEGSPSTHYDSTPSTWTYNSTGSLSFTLADGITLTMASSTNQLAWLTDKGLAARGHATLTVS